MRAVWGIVLSRKKRWLRAEGKDKANTFPTLFSISILKFQRGMRNSTSNYEKNITVSYCDYSVSHGISPRCNR